MRSEPGGTPRLRPPVAVLLSRFPRVTETFILREVVELERQGQPVVLVPLIRERPPVVHPEARPWVERARFTTWLSPAVARSNLRLLARRPGAWLGCLARLVRGMAASPGFLARSLALFPKAVHLTERLAGEGVVHVHAHFATHPATVAWVVERLAGIPFSVTVHAHDLFVRRTMLREKLGRARFVRAISRFNREYLAERYPEVAERVAVVHVGVEPERYRGEGQGSEAPAEAEKDRGAAGREVRVLTVAALERYKGIGVLIEAADLLRERLAALSNAPAVTWEVVGAGSLRGELEAEVARRGLDGAVRLAGALPEDEVARRLARADLFVLPSVVAPDGQMEGIPVALMEAMAAGRPVVASRLSGIPELVADGETGLLVPPGDAGAVVEAVARLLEEPGLGARLGEAGRRRVEEEFRLGTTVGELLGLLDRETAGWRMEPEL
ncbi:MAG TPA: glycosyltransferase, partial [Thermoanaerobaculia bacterium]|nr:glycosyltransferase [Thermoanaerobaculia bacterium]